MKQLQNSLHDSRELIEFRIKPVTRYALTKFVQPASEGLSHAKGSGSLSTVGEFQNIEAIRVVGNALAREARRERVAELRNVVFDGEELSAPEKIEVPADKYGRPTLPSIFQIGAKVVLRDCPDDPGIVRGVEFQEGKIHYLIEVQGVEEWCRIDSCLLLPFTEPADKGTVEFAVIAVGAAAEARYAYSSEEAEQIKAAAEAEHGREFRIYSRLAA